MRTDDPRLEAKRKELADRVNRMDELLVTIIKNHIALEQAMSEFLVASGKDPKDLDFYHKVKECEGLKPQEVEAPMWQVFYAANQLRNQMAHTYDEQKVKEKLDALRAKYIAALSTPAEVEAAKKLTDNQLSAVTMPSCGACLIVATDRVKAAGKK